MLRRPPELRWMQSIDSLASRPDCRVNAVRLAERAGIQTIWMIREQRKRGPHVNERTSVHGAHADLIQGVDV